MKRCLVTCDSTVSSFKMDIVLLLFLTEKGVKMHHACLCKYPALFPFVIIIVAFNWQTFLSKRWVSTVKPQNFIL